MSKRRIKKKRPTQNHQTSKSSTLSKEGKDKNSSERKRDIYDQFSAQRAISDQKYELFQTRFFNFLKRVAFISFFAILVALAGFMVVLVAFYLKGNEMAVMISNVVQGLMGVVSLIIGVWGLILARRSDKKSNQSNSLIDPLPVTRNPNPIFPENDVDRTKL